MHRKSSPRLSSSPWLVLAFSLLYNGSDRWNAKAAMDQIVEALGRTHQAVQR